MRVAIALVLALGLGACSEGPESEGVPGRRAQDSQGVPADSSDPPAPGELDGPGQPGGVPADASADDAGSPVPGGPAPGVRGAALEELPPLPGPDVPDGVSYWFSDITEASGLGAFQQVNGAPEKPFIVETVGGGVALVDVDLDGDLDAYLTNGGRLGAGTEGAPRDALYLNDGSGRFVDGTAAAGLGDAHWTNGVRVADVNGDGAPDLYLTNYGPNVLYLNNGDGTFEDVTDAAGVGDTRWSTGAAFLDFDRDGDLDLYVANYVQFREKLMLREKPTATYRGLEVMKGPRGLKPVEDRFYVNDGNGVFRDASAELGIDEVKLFGFQCVAFDANGDGWVDVYVANDSVENVLWTNLEGEGFSKTAFMSGLELSLSGQPQAGMGVGLGDFDGDLLVDVYVTNFADDYFTLYRGSERGNFVDQTSRLKLIEPTRKLLGWACGFEDLDNDGDVEIFAAAGHVYPQVDELDVGSTYRQPNQLLEWDGEGFRVPEGGGGPGFEVVASSRGAALGDIDADGDLDILFGNLDGPPTLLRNDGARGNWLRVRVVGKPGNRDAVGTRLVVDDGERRQLRLVATAAGFLSSSEPDVHVGLGARESVESIEVRWDDGEVERFGPFPANSRVRIERGAGEEGGSLVSVD